jgi:ferredoxin-NADP reductase
VRILISLTLAGLFVFLAGFNVWNMLSNRTTSGRRSRLWSQVHRIAGYTFIAVFAVNLYFMLLRVKGWQDELSPRLVLHMGLALFLVPMLVGKVLVARYQKAARSLLTVLGIGIFGTAFTLVAMNVAIHFLRVASPHKLPAWTPAMVIMGVLVSVVTAYRGGSKQSKAAIGAATFPGKNIAIAGKDPPKTDEVVLNLTRIETQTQDAKTLRFLLPLGQQLSTRPGQFLTFEWIIDGRPLTRSYSICSSPLQRGYIEITPKRVENGCVSRYLNERAEVGLTVKARGPYGKFYFDESQHKRIVLIAAGSGVTPMMAMLKYIDNRCIPTEATLIYCVRTRQDVFFRSELSQLQTRLRQFRWVTVLSQPSSEWAGWKGRLRREILEREVQKPLEATFFLCGPPAFMELSRSLLADFGVVPSRILQESFGGAVPGKKRFSGSGEDIRTGAGSPEVTFARSAVAFPVSPEETLLESSERNGVLMPSGCRRGSCGTCATKLLRGRVKMESEEALSDQMRSQGYILPCVSRALENVTLDA